MATFGWNFNQQVELPQNLIHLTFGEFFNQQVELPFNVVYLKLNSNNNIIDYLPSSIEELELGLTFNLELNNLPNSIKKISFILCCKYNKQFIVIQHLLKFI